ncbi:MAG TPA: double-strand break repair helicase AddA [Roseiarcus sp.]|nr:double-strand break repair helicase AddA [Roseiarcus sp.]
MKPALQDASRRQREAADPQSSAWVSANAGSGKTHVLALRVVRLLLAGAAPSRLLCLTFTKAAAANMAERVFDRLAKWTRLDDAALAADIIAAGAPQPTAADLERARKMFARVIETPGGLKIQTIHAFCERVLHLFPFEANVPAGFRPLDEREAASLREQAQAQLFARADAELAAAIARVAAEAGADGFGPLIAETARLGEALTVHGAADEFAAKLAARLGLAPGEDEATITEAMREGGGGPAVWRQWAKALNQGSANDQKTAAILTGAAATPDPQTRLDLYLAAFLTKEQAPRKTLATKATSERCPDIVDALYAERDRLVGLLDKARAAAAVARSRDLRRLSEACERAYKRAKAARAALDFDDLIAKTEALFARADAAWVLYKLDRGVEHILVDEAQDTSRAQWKILAKLAEDFLSGAGAGAGRRTFFAVGDEKQSIFSFQGAQPHLFDAMRRFFASRHKKAELAFVDVKLTHSFRSAPAVLDAVDKVFAVAEVWNGVSAGEATAEPHAPIHDSLPGLVEIWPPIVAEEALEPDDWEAPLDAEKRSHPAQLLAERIAAAIARWIAPGSQERVADPATGALRPIRPGDVLILVRSRGALFEAMTRALRRARVPAAGADRLTLASHIAVLDLCAAARVALYPDDDLSLAALLKSPLIGLDDEALMALAPGRKGALAAELAASQSQAWEKVSMWRARAGLGPFDFFARLIGADGGRRALAGRLGAEAGDAIDEFLARALAHEQGEAPSLASFLTEIEAADSQIKRDMEAAGAAVRVMTVHASKGLEAPIVFLPDTAGAPSGRHDPHWLELTPAHSGAAPLLVWAGSAGQDSAAMAEGRAVARAEAAGEHRRLLYVAMTRAAQRLIVAGFEGARGRPPECWANLIALGLQEHMREVPSWWDATQPMLRLGQPPSGGAPPASAVAPPQAPPPAWLAAPAPHEVAYAPVAPSRRLAGELTAERLARLEEGRLAHRLLQSLPGLPPQRRRAAAEAYLARRAASLSPERRAGLAARALALIEASALRPLFGPGSRAEAPFVAALARADGQTVAVSGRIDRLAIADGIVWIADFKTGPAVVRREYQRQLALYRAAAAAMFAGAEIRAVLLWIDSGEFEELDALTLDKAFQDWAGEAASPS